MIERFNYDVIVIGGGAAGFAAAIGATKAGAHCLLIERNGSLGGQATNANVASYCGFFTHAVHPHQIVQGVGNELLEKLKKIGYYDKYILSPVGNAIVTLDIEATKYAFDELASDYKLDVLLHCRAINCTMSTNKHTIISVTCADDETIYEFTAKAFVDGSGDANLAHMAGASIRYGDGNGTGQASTRMMQIDRVSSEVKFKPSILEEIFTKAKKDGYKHLTKESGIVFRTNDDTVFAILPSVWVPALDARTLTACEINTRKQAQEYMEVFHKYMPGMENCRLISTGANLGIRDTRHIIGKETLSYDNVINGLKPETGIARGAWPCEMHIDINKMAQYVFLKEDDYYRIPFGCLVPQDISNLWCAGRTISADAKAFASVRVMGTGFATGHAAGVAAALHVNNATSSVQDVQKELQKQNALI